MVGIKIIATLLTSHILRVAAAVNIWDDCHHLRTTLHPATNTNYNISDIHEINIFMGRHSIHITRKSAFDLQ